MAFVKWLFRWVILPLVVLASVTYVYLLWVFWEPYDFTEGSMAYSIKLDSEVKKFPAWEPNTNPRYEIQMGDGTKEYRSIVKYRSKLTQVELIAKLKSLNFECLRHESGVEICDLRNNEKLYLLNAWVDTSDDSDLTPMVLTFIGI